MKKFLFALTLIGLLVSAAPVYAGCVMEFGSADRVIAEQGMKKHILTSQRMSAFVEVVRERNPMFALETDTTVIWLLESPKDGVGYFIEVNDTCVTYLPEEMPLEAIRHLLNEIGRRTAGGSS